MIDPGELAQKYCFLRGRWSTIRLQFLRVVNVLCTTKHTMLLSTFSVHRKMQNGKNIQWLESPLFQLESEHNLNTLKIRAVRGQYPHF